MLFIYMMVIFLMYFSASSIASDGGVDRLRMPPPPPFSMDAPLLTSSPALHYQNHRISLRSVSQPSSAQDVSSINNNNYSNN